ARERVRRRVPGPNAPSKRLRERRLDTTRTRRAVRRGGRGMNVTVPKDAEFALVVREIAERVASAAADAVDRENRFPHEALDALREAEARSGVVPASPGVGRVC